MKWIYRLYNNMFLRELLSDLGIRTWVAQQRKDYTPYFQYRIGREKPGYLLFFRIKPGYKKYTDSIFKRLYQCSPRELTAFLEFHYAACADREGFLQFLLNEARWRCDIQPNKRTPAKLIEVIRWTNDKIENRSQQKSWPGKYHQ